MADELTTDACGQPLAPSCVPGTFDLPACYSVGGGPVLPGFQQITRDANCRITSTQILDADGAPVVGGALAACPGTPDNGIVIQEDGAAIAAGVNCINFVGATVTPGPCVTVTIAGGAPVFPLLAPDGSCAAPSYSFASNPQSGMFMSGATLVIATNNCDDFIELGASVNIGSNLSGITLSASTFVIIGAGTTIDMSLASHLSLNGVPGVAGQVLTSQGPGLPPVWA